MEGCCASRLRSQSTHSRCPVIHCPLSSSTEWDCLPVRKQRYCHSDRGLLCVASAKSTRKLPFQVTMSIMAGKPLYSQRCMRSHAVVYVFGNPWECFHLDLFQGTVEDTASPRPQTPEALVSTNHGSKVLRSQKTKHIYIYFFQISAPGRLVWIGCLYGVGFPELVAEDSKDGRSNPTTLQEPSRDPVLIDNVKATLVRCTCGLR